MIQLNLLQYQKYSLTGQLQNPTHIFHLRKVRKDLLSHFHSEYDHTEYMPMEWQWFGQRLVRITVVQARPSVWFSKPDNEGNSSMLSC